MDGGYAGHEHPMTILDAVQDALFHRGAPGEPPVLVEVPTQVHVRVDQAR